MKRALLVVLAGLAVPASALAQSSGAISFPTGFTSINLAQCTGTPSVLDNDDLNVDLTWNVNPVGSVFSGGTLNLFAMTQQPAAGQVSGTSTLTSCTTLANGNPISPTPGKVSDTDGVQNITPGTQTTGTDTFSLSKIVAGAGIGDCTNSSATVYLCMQWTSGSAEGYAVTKVSLDTTPPAKPTSVGWDPGDSLLHVRASVDSTTSSCKAIATSTADSTTESSGEEACDSLTIKHLTNNVPYTVVVYAIDAANNPSPASDAVTATPYPTDDFWDHYKSDNGQEKGGCSTAAGGAGLLLSLLGLLAIRRRKP